MSNCYKSSNNKHFNAPPRMSDGRHFTDYRPNCHLNNSVKLENQIPNSYDYRLFLIRNADKLMDLNRKQSTIMNGSYECKKPYNQGTMLPEQDIVVCNTQTCNVKHNYDNGLGLGREYANPNNMSECLQSYSSPPMNLNSNTCVPMNIRV